jgi:hypothetical protein
MPTRSWEEGEEVEGDAALEESRLLKVLRSRKGCRSRRGTAASEGDLEEAGTEILRRNRSKCNSSAGAGCEEDGRMLHR